MKSFYKLILVSNALVGSLVPVASGGQTRSPEVVRGINNLLALDGVYALGLRQTVGQGLGPRLNLDRELDGRLVQGLARHLPPHFEDSLAAQSLSRPELDLVFKDPAGNMQFIAAVSDRRGVWDVANDLQAAYQAAQPTLAPALKARQELLAAAAGENIFDGAPTRPPGKLVAMLRSLSQIFQELSQDRPAGEAPDKRVRLLLRSGGPIGSKERLEHLRLLESNPRVAILTAANPEYEEGHYRHLKWEALSLAPHLQPLHLRWNSDPLKTLERAQAVIVGGGSTYLLLERLRQSGLLEALRRRILAGMPYIGSSAGAIIAGPNIRTNMDRNFIAAKQFDSLGVAPFNVTPHYERIRDALVHGYHLIESNPVFGITDFSYIVVRDGQATAQGSIKGFFKGRRPLWHMSGDKLAP